MDYNKLQISSFELKNMQQHPAIVMIAKRGTGKSWVTRDIIYHYRNIPGGIVLAPTDRVTPFYRLFFPDLYIHYDIKEVILKKIMARQLIMTQKAEKKKKQGLNVDPSAILVMDDCLARKKSWAKDETIIEILMNGRHYKLTYILTMQTPLGITPDLRLNFDYVFLLKEEAHINKKKLWENYASIFRTVHEFNKVFTVCTQDFGAMVIDNRKPADSIPEKIFWFKAKDRQFQFGSKEFRRLGKKFYNPRWESKKHADLMNMDLLFGRKPKNEIDIKIERI